MVSKTKQKRFCGELKRGRLMFKCDGLPASLDCYFHTSFGSGRTSVYLEPSQAEELRKRYLRNGITMELDREGGGYWSNASGRRRGYYDDARPFIPYRCYFYNTEDGKRLLYCLTDIVTACGIAQRIAESNEERR